MNTFKILNAVNFVTDIKSALTNKMCPKTKKINNLGLIILYFQGVFMSVGNSGCKQFV